MKRFLIGAVAFSAMVGGAFSGVTATANEEGAAQDTAPLVVSMTPEVHHRQSVFRLQFDSAQGKERRFITSVLAVKDTTTRLFLGQELSCTSPSGVRTVGIETGRNFWQGGLGLTVASFVLRVNEAGRWTCESTVNLCSPGQCGSGKGSGTLTLDVRSNNPLSVMKVSQPLDMWSKSTRLVTRDIALRPGKSVTLSKTIPVGAGSQPTVVGEFSFSNCIEPTYPKVCASLPSHNVNGSATASVGMTITQVPTTAGAKCTVVSVNREQGAVTRTISAQQHHATFSLEMPRVALVDSPNCSNNLRVAVTFRAIRGNGIALEGGSRKKPMSLISVGRIDGTYQVVPVLS